MNPPRPKGFVRMPDAEFEAILMRAAEEGAKRARATQPARSTWTARPSRALERRLTVR